ncbi:MAG: PorP/SprF family type IX secretion system membrane protein [Flavobacteriia bacterium]|jgi:type IX secretion system PorP/SprF family membrane protein
MRLVVALLFIFSLNFSFSQMKFKFKQYMLHQTIYNPGYVDVETKFSVNSIYRRQWLRKENFPEAFMMYGHYNFDRNHGVGLILTNDLINKYNQFEIGANYVYNIPIGNYNLGLGVKVGFIEQNLIYNQLTYFDPVEPVLAEGNYTSRFLNIGTGISLTSRDLNIHIGLPQLFGNRFINQDNIYNLKSNNLFFNAGYKYHYSDWFVVYPNMMLYAIKGSKFHSSYNVHFLASQFIWFGGGVDSELTVNASLGVFLQSGIRFVYAVDNRFFPRNQTTGFSHEVSLSYAKTIKDNPFSKRRMGRGMGGRRRFGIR